MTTTTMIISVVVIAILTFICTRVVVVDGEKPEIIKSLILTVGAVLLASITFCMIYLAGDGRVWAGLLALIGAIVLDFLVVYYWRMSGTTLKQMIPFVALVAIIFFTMLLPAGMLLAKALDYSVPGLAATGIPFAVMIASLGIIAYDYFTYRAGEEQEKNAIESNKTMARNVAFVATIAVIACLICWPLFVAHAALNDDTRGGNLKPPVTEEELEAQKTLTVEKLTKEELESLTLSKYSEVSQVLLTSSLSPEDKQRTESTGFSDALTYGFKATDNAGMLAELEEEILRNPVYGVTVANAIKDKTIGSTRIGELNPWMDEMVELNTKYGVTYWLEHRGNDESTIYVTEEYRIYAATLCTWLERLVTQGVHAWPTIENWPLNMAATNNERAGVKADYQYTKDAFILSYVGKDVGAGNGTADSGNGVITADGPVGLFTIGFNIHDKRPEFYGVTPEVKQPEKTDVPKVEPENKGDNPKKPEPTPDKKKSSKKNPAKDAVNNGNSDRGGGQGKTTDNSGDYQKNDPRTEKPTGNANNNNQGHSDPATVTPATPSQDQSHQGQQTVDHENKMDYAPDTPTSRGSTSGKQPTSSGGDGEFTPED